MAYVQVKRKTTTTQDNLRESSNFMLGSLSPKEINRVEDLMDDIEDIEGDNYTECPRAYVNFNGEVI